MKKIKLFVFAICAILVSIVGVSAQDVNNESTLTSCLGGSDSICTLTDDFTSSSSYILVNSNITKTIDFANHKITFNNSTFGLLVYTNVTLKNGTLESLTGNNDTAPLTIYNGSTVNLESMNIHGTNGYGISLYNVGNNTVNVDKNTIVTSDGNNAVIYAFGTSSTHTINVYGQVKNNNTDPSKAFAAINSSYTGGVVNINIYDGAVVDGGKGAGILQMANGTVTVNGGSVSGNTGIAMTKGNLVVNGGTITGTGNYQSFTATAGFKVNDNGAAIYVEPTTAMDVDINGGNLVSDNSYAFSAPATNDDNDNLTISISNGSFNGSKGAIELVDDDREPFITGGQFSGMDHTHEDYLVSGYEYLDNGLVVTDADYTDLYATISVAKGYDFSKYTDESVKALLEAIEDAENVEQGLKSNEQYKINNLRNAIIAAIVNLVEKEDIPVKPGSSNPSNTDEKAPNTFDAGLVYMGLALSAIGTSVISVRKLRNN